MPEAVKVHVAAVVGLGEGNRGNIGPDQLDPQAAEGVINDIGNERYAAPASNTWICVDGRVRPADADKLEEVAHQIAGGLPFTDAASRLMQPVTEGTTHSAVIKEVTEKAVAAEKVVYVHGDDNHASGDNKAGCGANKQLRDTLRDNARNVAVVAPFAWQVGEGLGLDQQLQQSDVNQLVVTGAENAENETIWDVTPEEAVETALSAGARYEQYTGPHREAIIRADMTVGAFDKDLFVSEHDAQAFAASFGAYKKYKFEQVAANGGSEYDAALEVMGALLYNIAVCKALNNDSTQIAVIAQTA